MTQFSTVNQMIDYFYRDNDDEKNYPTQEQEKVITAGLRPIEVIAGAGSGKTETMAQRVVWNIAQGNVAPGEVLGLTFTNKAARELEQRINERVDAILGPNNGQRDRVKVSTYNGFGAELISEFGYVLGVSHDSQLMTETTAYTMLYSIIDSIDTTDPETVQALTTKSKAALAQNALDFVHQINDHLIDTTKLTHYFERFVTLYKKRENTARKQQRLTNDEQKLVDAALVRLALIPCVEEFNRQKRSRQLLEYSDQISLGIELAKNDHVRDIIRQRYKLVMLDEFQDTSVSQVLMLSGFFRDHPVTAVGDPHQAIYGWRGASQSNLVQFFDDFTSSGSRDHSDDIYPLTYAWRNDYTILDIANKTAQPLWKDYYQLSDAISGNRDDRPLKERIAENELKFRSAQRQGKDAGVVYVRGHNDDRELYDDLATWIDTNWNRTDSIAVLGRKHAQLERMDAVLRSHGIPTSYIGLKGLLLEPEVQDIRAVLSVLADGTDGVALMRLFDREGIGPHDIRMLYEYAHHIAKEERPVDNGHPTVIVMDALEALDAIDLSRFSLSPTAIFRFKRLTRQLQLARQATSLPLPQLVDAIVRIFDIDVEVSIGNYGVKRTMTIESFQEITEEYTRLNPDSSVDMYVQWLAIAESKDRGFNTVDLGGEEGTVHLLTVHGAKGLEWDHVIVVGLTNEIFPSINVKNGNEVTSSEWLSACGAVPFALRHDVDAFEQLPFDKELLGSGDVSVWDKKDLDQAIKSIQESYGMRDLAEERRLAYVAFTRAKHTLILAGAMWNSGNKRRKDLSIFMTELVDDEKIKALLTPFPGYDQLIDDASEQSPFDDEVEGEPWPVRPLSPLEENIVNSAHRVAKAIKDVSIDEQLNDLLTQPFQALGDGDKDVDVMTQAALLIKERDANVHDGDDLPSLMSVTEMSRLLIDPDKTIESLKRPLPQKPTSSLKVGTNVHEWIEEYWRNGCKAPDIDDYPAESHSTIRDAHKSLTKWRLDERFTFKEAEQKFEAVVGDRKLSGKFDALFTDDQNDRYVIVDWKTGVNHDRLQPAYIEQLRIYRYALSRQRGIPQEQIDAYLAYVSTGELVNIDEADGATGRKRYPDEDYCMKRIDNLVS